MDGDENSRSMATLEAAPKRAGNCRKVCPLVGSDRSRCAAQLSPKFADPFGDSRIFARLARPAGLEPATPGLEGRFLCFASWSVFGHFSSRVKSADCGNLLKRMEP